DASVHDALYAGLDLLPDELRRVAHRDREAVQLGDPGLAVVETDLDELELELLAFLDRRLGRELLRGTLGDHLEVVDRHALAALDEEASLRDGLDLREPRRARPDQHRGDVRVQRNLEGL